MTVQEFIALLLVNFVLPVLIVMSGAYVIVQGYLCVEAFLKARRNDK